MTNEQINQAARKLCLLNDVDPDEIAMVEVLPHEKGRVRWQIAVDVIRDHILIERAIQYAKDLVS